MLRRGMNRVAPVDPGRRLRPAARAGRRGPRRRRARSSTSTSWTATSSRRSRWARWSSRRCASSSGDARRAPDDRAPERQVDGVRQGRGATRSPFHVEATPHIHYTLAAIRDAGCRAGLAVCPARRRRCYRRGRARHGAVHDRQPGLGRPDVHRRPRSTRSRGCAALLGETRALEVDGGIDVRRPRAAAPRAGATLFVAGSAVFGAADPARGVSAAGRGRGRAGARRRHRAEGASPLPLRVRTRPSAPCGGAGRAAAIPVPGAGLGAVGGDGLAAALAEHEQPRAQRARPRRSTANPQVTTKRSCSAIASAAASSETSAPVSAIAPARLGERQRRAAAGEGVQEQRGRHLRQPSAPGHADAAHEPPLAQDRRGQAPAGLQRSGRRSLSSRRGRVAAAARRARTGRAAQQRRGARVADLRAQHVAPARSRRASRRRTAPPATSHDDAASARARAPARPG